MIKAVKFFKSTFSQYFSIVLFDLNGKLVINICFSLLIKSTFRIKSAFGVISIAKQTIFEIKSVFEPKSKKHFFF